MQQPLVLNQNENHVLCLTFLFPCFKLHLVSKPVAGESKFLFLRIISDFSIPVHILNEEYYKNHFYELKMSNIIGALK